MSRAAALGAARSARPLVARVAPALGILRPPAATGFVLRTLLAFSLALYAAYALELPSPASAATTVLIVSNSTRGAVLSKGFWRIVGSTVGAIAAVVLIALFAQSPVLFVLGLAAWLGLATFVSSLLRYFRSYGAVLAGYTVVLVATGAVSNPDNIFLLAADRLAVVTLGVVASGVVSMATDLGPTGGELAATLSRLIASAAQLIADAQGSAGRTAFPAARSRVAADLTSLDQTVEYAAVDDAGFAYARDLRLAAAYLFAALTGGPRAAMLLAEACPQRPDIAQTRERLDALLARIADPAALAADPAGIRDEIAATRGLLATRARALEASAAPALPVIAALDQSVALLAQFDVPIEVLAAMQSGRRHRNAPRMPNYVNPHTALRNGTRAFLAVTIAGLFWIVSAWPQGGVMLAALGPITGLLAQADSAAIASVGFLRGMILAAATAFVCTFGLLPQVAGFPLLLAVMLPFVTLGLLAGFWPPTASLATPFLIFYVTLTGPTNPMRYDLAAYLNTATAFILGAGCGVLTFRVLLPPDPAREARTLARSIRADIRNLLRRPLAAFGSQLAWEHLQHQKMVRLGRRLAASPERRRAAIEAAGGGVLIGRQIARLRLLGSDPSTPPLARNEIGRVLSALRRERAEAAATLAASTADALAHPDAAPLVVSAAAALGELAALLARHGGFVDGTAWPEQAA